MGGEPEQPGGRGAEPPQPPGGAFPGDTPAGEFKRFRRGLDGKIYHYPPIRERLTDLRNRYRDSYRQVSLLLTLPFAGVMIMLSLYIGFMPMLALAPMVGLVVLVTGLFGVGLYFLIRSFFQSKLNAQRNQLSYQLRTTNLPVLIADESSWQRVREQAGDVPSLRWLGIPSLGRFEENLLFAAAYLDVLEGFRRGPLPASPHKLRHGSCLYWLSTSPASTIGWTAACGCVLPWLNSVIWFAVFPLIIGTNRYIELAGNVTAICDYFLAGADNLEPVEGQMGDGSESQLPRPRPLRDAGDDTLADLQRRAGEQATE